MKPAHTPGPWTFAKGKHRIEVRTTPALSYAFSLSDEANARLIAAAPELLAALESIAAIVPAIMSTEAEQGFRYNTAEDAYRVHLAGLINQARAQARAAIDRATGGAA